MHSNNAVITVERKRNFLGILQIHPIKGNPDSENQETFARGIQNQENIYLWNLESRKHLLVESGIQKIFACGIWNPENICLWNPEFRKYLLMESGIQKIFACRIRNPENICLWNLESKKYLLVESGIQKIFACGIGVLLFRIRNPGLGVQNSRKPNLLESRIQ